MGRPTPPAGPTRGPITRAFLKVLEALLWGFHNSRDGRCFPSYEAIAAKAECARSVVAEALKVLELAGVLTWGPVLRAGGFMNEEAAARAVNAEPWEPLPGMVKRQCPRCRYYFAASPDTDEPHCTDCRGRAKP